MLSQCQIFRTHRLVITHPNDICQFFTNPQYMSHAIA